MPTNLYGPGDNFDLNSSHVMLALIRNHPSRGQHRFDLCSLFDKEQCHRLNSVAVAMFS
jgi:nucleoside-diphosphate-sugar epimerase